MVVIVAVVVVVAKMTLRVQDRRSEGEQVRSNQDASKGMAPLDKDRNAEPD